MGRSILAAKQIEKLKESFSGEMRIDEPMKLHTSFQIGGNADLLIMPKTLVDLKNVIEFAKKENLPLTFIGGGTNLLVLDGGIRGIVVKLSETFDYVHFDDLHVTVGTATNLSSFAKACANRGLSGIEFAYGIPGSVGGALTMNAGAFGGKIGDLVESVKAIDMSGQEIFLTSDDMKFANRQSVLQTGEFIAYEATLRLNKGEVTSINAVMDDHLNRRKEKQPLHLPSAGCVFRNPENGGAGRYIDMAGLKDTRIGNAKISDIHANFIVNLGDAKASDVIELLKLIKKKVGDEYNVELVPEVRIIGDGSTAV